MCTRILEIRAMSKFYVYRQKFVGFWTLFSFNVHSWSNKRKKCNLRKLKYQGKLLFFLLTVFVSPYTDWRTSWTLSCRCVCRYLNRVLSVFIETSQHSVINRCGENAYTAIVDVNVVTYDHSVHVA